MNVLSKTSLMFSIGVVLIGCSTASPSGKTAQPTGMPPAPTAAPRATPTPTLRSAPSPSPNPAAQDIWSFEPLGPIEPGTYFVDPDLDPSTALRVVYDVPAQGWSMWVGGTKFSDAGHTSVSITTVVNLVADGCHSSWAEPPVGPSVDDLTTALAALSPFQVTSPPSDVTIYGYDGKHLEWTVPDLPVTGEGDHQKFAGCVGGQLKSWVAPFDTEEPGDAFYGYTGPGYTRRVLDPRRQRHTSDDRGRHVAGLALRGHCRARRDARLDPDRVVIA